MRAGLAAAALACAAMLAANAAQARQSLKMTNLVQRTGPFSTGGGPLADGQRDYMAMVNARDGGVNGVLLGYEECETGHDAARWAECFETAAAEAVAVLSSSPMLSPDLTQLSHRARVPLLAPGHGASALADGRVFPWAFNAPVTLLEGASMLIAHAGEGDPANLTGRRIALLHLDSAYGREPLPLLEQYARRHGFEFVAVPVAAAEIQNQAAQWRIIAEHGPDFVLLWGWGPMNEAALKEARRTGFPMERLLGIWWSGHEGDLEALGAQARGYRALTWNLPAPDAGVIADIRRHAGDAARAAAADGMLYQRGIVTAMIAVEALRNAQEEFDTRIVDAAQMRWGLENLDLDEERLEELGMAGMVAPFGTGCADHAGRGSGWIVEWDGGTFVAASGVLRSDGAAVATLQGRQARSFAQENAPWPLGEECPG